MDGIDNVRSAAVHYKRRRAQRRARKEVDDAYAVFCAIRECTTPQVSKGIVRENAPPNATAVLTVLSAVRSA